MSARLPSATRMPSTVHVSPRPLMASTWSGTPSGSAEAACAWLRMALPKGCSDPDSADPTRRKKSASDTRLVMIWTSVTAGLPWVRVPVLSKMMAVTRCAVSSGSPPLMRQPSFAPTPVPTMTAVGVARPRLQGHAMTRTAMAKTRENTPSSSVLPMYTGSTRPVLAAANQAAHTINAIRMTVGTKTREMVSASFWIGALEDCAPSTSWMICCNAESAPHRVTSTCRTPFWLVVPPMVADPTVLCTGIDSPVIIASSTRDSPWITRPSPGIFSPGHTLSTSPICMRSTGMVRSSKDPSARLVNNVALSARSSISF
mmetsp:Transcript_10135/g.23746  ORF Transcript_10135/g.23746 Transcript_10135/m.23746 type:complete len:315 (+) Transcript_10135:2897-3841(+)